jgi:hypothetical protein
MNMISGLPRFQQPSATRRQPAFFLGLALTAALLSSGCSKSKPDVQTPVMDTNQPAAAMTPAPQYAPAPVVVAASPDGGADLKQLNHAYIGWIVQNRRRPKDINEFVALSGIQLPPAPAGKKYVIDQNGFINYANN